MSSVDSAQPLNEALRTVCRQYPSPDEMGDSNDERRLDNFPELQKLFKEQATTALQDVLSEGVYDSLSIDYGLGAGTIAHIPYLPVFHSTLTESTQSGIYIVYLFDPITDSVYLTLNQGSVEAGELANRSGSSLNKPAALRAFAHDYRERFNTGGEGSVEVSERWVLDEAGLSEDLSRSQDYNAGTICYVEYGIGDLANQKRIEADLQDLARIYLDLLESLYQWPQLDIDRDIWKISPEGNTLSGPWLDQDVASLAFPGTALPDDLGPHDEEPGRHNSGIRQVYYFEQKISEGDIIIAGSQHRPADRVYALGVVDKDYEGTNQDSSVLDQTPFDEEDHSRFITVDWFPVADEHLVVTVDPGDGSKALFHQHTIEPVQEPAFSRLIGELSRRSFVLGLTDSQKELWETFTEDCLDQTATIDPDDMPHIDLSDERSSETAPYYWVNQGADKEEIAGAYLQAPRDQHWYHDLPKLEEDDIVFNYHEGEVLGYSIVEGLAYLYEDQSSEEHYRIDVEFQPFDEPLQFAEIFAKLQDEEFLLDKYNPVNPAGINQQYLYNLSEKAGEYLLARGGSKSLQPSRLEERLELPELSVDLPDDLYFQDGEQARLRRQIIAALNSGKHIIFTGPPGTGKSRLARHICGQTETLEAVDGYTFTTATAEWTTFDTIGGYVPQRHQDSEQLVFDPRLFLQCFRGDDGNVRNEWLVIDELNRADIDKAFGQLFSVLSGDSVELPYERKERICIDWVDDGMEPNDRAEIARNDDRFPVTPAWRLIATMNTYDKTSLYELSYAFMRRFNFIHVGIPALKEEDGTVKRELLDPAESPNYASRWISAYPHLEGTIEEWHEQLSVVWSILNEHRSIGPSIILDMIRHLDAYEGGDRDAPLTSAVVGLTFPQLEGMRQSEQEDLLDDLAEGGQIRASSSVDGTAPVDLDLEMAYLRTKAEDMFDFS